MIKLSGNGDDIEENKKRMMECVDSGEAYMKFLELIEKERVASENLMRANHEKQKCFSIYIHENRKCLMRHVHENKKCLMRNLHENKKCFT